MQGEHGVPRVSTEYLGSARSTEGEHGVPRVSTEYQG